MSNITYSDNKDVNCKDSDYAIFLLDEMVKTLPQYLKGDSIIPFGYVRHFLSFRRFTKDQSIKIYHYWASNGRVEIVRSRGLKLCK